jgi:phosphoglycerate dehydrogenase-like enzyme
MSRPKALYVLSEDSAELIYGPDERRAIADLVDVISDPLTQESIADDPRVLRDVEILLTGWGAPVVDEEFLNAAPRLKAVFYAAGSVAGWLTPAVWHRGIVVSSAYAANAVPVAEYTVSAIVLSLKHAWQLGRQARSFRRLPDRNGAPGCYGSTVGLLSLGVTGRAVRRLLRAFDL